MKTASYLPEAQEPVATWPTASNGHSVTVTSPDGLGLHTLTVGSGEDVSVVKLSAESLRALEEYFMWAQITLTPRQADHVAVMLSAEQELVETWRQANEIMGMRSFQYRRESRHLISDMSRLAVMWEKVRPKDHDQVREELAGIVGGDLS